MVAAIKRTRRFSLATICRANNSSQQLNLSTLCHSSSRTDSINFAKTVTFCFGRPAFWTETNHPWPEEEFISAREIFRQSPTRLLKELESGDFHDHHRCFRSYR
jgi:hypothetical protein